MAEYGKPGVRWEYQQPEREIPQTKASLGTKIAYAAFVAATAAAVLALAYEIAKGLGFV